MPAGTNTRRQTLGRTPCSSTLSCSTLTFLVDDPTSLSEGLFDDVTMAHMVPMVWGAHAA